MAHAAPGGLIGPVVGHTGAMDLAGLLLTGELDSAAYHAAVEAASVDDIEAVLELTRHADPAVRGAAARTLPLLTHGAPPTSEMVDAAVELTVDQDRLVRDYACLALGEQWRDIDTPAVREALVARLDDIDRDARCEALLGTGVPARPAGAAPSAHRTRPAVRRRLAAGAGGRRGVG